MAISSGHNAGSALESQSPSKVSCRASLEYLKVSGAKPDIIHVHEWQTSAVPMLYWEAYASQGLPDARLVLTIHCLDNSGECREDEFAFTGAGAAPGRCWWGMSCQGSSLELQAKAWVVVLPATECCMKRGYRCWQGGQTCLKPGITLIWRQPLLG